MQDSPRMRPRHCTVHNYLIIAIQNSLANCPRHILLRFISRYNYILSGSWWERDTLKVSLEWLIVSWKLTPCLFPACSKNFLSSGKLYGPQYNLRRASWCCNKFTRIRRDNIFINIACYCCGWHLLCKKGIAMKQLDADKRVFA